MKKSVTTEELDQIAHLMLAQEPFSEMVGFTTTTSGGKTKAKPRVLKLTKLKFTKQSLNVYNFLNYLRHPLKHDEECRRVIKISQSKRNNDDVIHTRNEFFATFRYKSVPDVLDYYPNDTFNEHLRASVGVYCYGYIIKRKTIEKHYFSSRNTDLFLNALHSAGLMRKCKEHKRHIGNSRFRSEGTSFCLTTKGQRCLEAITFN
jgi:hypothetical protein